MSVEQQIEKLQGLLERVQRNAALPRQAAPPPAMAAAAPEPAVEEPVAEEQGIEDVELYEDDIVDLTVEEVGAEEIAEEGPGFAELMPQGPELEEDIFFEDEEEIEPPASSRRPKVATSMDEALAGAAELDMDQGREVPLKTPPPESGRQVAAPPAGLHQSAPPADLDAGVDELLEADISSGTQHAKPTPEQLGQTIELEEAGGAPLELEAPPPTPAPTRPEELEAPLPPVQPPAARAEPAARPAEIEPAEEVKPEVVERAAVAASGPAAEFVAAHREFKPQSFLELLDASLKLGG